MKKLIKITCLIIAIVALAFLGSVLIHINSAAQDKTAEKNYLNYEDYAETQSDYIIPDPCGLATVECSYEVEEYVPEPVETIYDSKLEHAKSSETNAIVFAYNADPAQTDGNPCRTASGFDVCNDKSVKVVANNCLKFGTKVIIAGVEYEVQDRLNSRYSCEYYDIFMESYDDAIKWGKRYLKIEVLN